LAIVIFLSTVIAFAQDEGEITKKARIGRSNNIFFGIGPSFNFGKNVGDYGTGLNFEIGYSKRVNRLLSIGPSISFIKFSYSPDASTAENGNAYYGSGDISINYPSSWDTWNEKYVLDETFEYAYGLTLRGGDISLLSLSVNIKLNLVPVKDTSPISVYIFAKPFVTQATRKAVYGEGVRYVYEAFEVRNEFEEYYDELFYNTGDDTWYLSDYSEDWGPDSFEALKEDKVITGGIFVGPGIELFPAKKLSFFFQPAIGYTFPITFVSTGSYDNTIDSYVNDEFPIVKKGFTSLNLQLGLSYNF
jgi:hypothetical protein